MFILDSLMISGIRWALETALTAAEAEMNDDSVLREQLLEAEMRREMGDISDAAFRELEADLLARIRQIKERREGAGPLEFGAQPLESTDEDRFTIEATVSGDFHEPADAPHTTIVEPLEHHHAAGHLVGTSGTESIRVLDVVATEREQRTLPDGAGRPARAPSRPGGRKRAARKPSASAARPTRTGTARTARTSGAARTVAPRTARTKK